MSKEKVDLKNFFLGLQKTMTADLEMSKNFTHPVSKGNHSEMNWNNLLINYLPKRYSASAAFLVDSDGNVSEQIDLVIYDALYTPFIFNENSNLYIPVESVYAVFEVKPSLRGDYIQYAGEKIESVRKLKRTSMSMVSSGVSMKPRALTPILGGILTTSAEGGKRMSTLKSKLEKVHGLGSLDIICCLKDSAFFIEYDTHGLVLQENNRSVYAYYKQRTIKNIVKSSHETTLLEFYFKLIMELKLIGTVPAIDVNEYLKAVDISV